MNSVTWVSARVTLGDFVDVAISGEDSGCVNAVTWVSARVTLTMLIGALPLCLLIKLVWDWFLFFLSDHSIRLH